MLDDFTHQGKIFWSGKGWHAKLMFLLPSLFDSMHSLLIFKAFFRVSETTTFNFLNGRLSLKCKEMSWKFSLHQVFHPVYICWWNDKFIDQNCSIMFSAQLSFFSSLNKCCIHWNFCLYLISKFGYFTVHNVDNSPLLPYSNLWYTINDYYK